jgi:hypothetical protein
MKYLIFFGKKKQIIIFLLRENHPENITGTSIN